MEWKSFVVIEHEGKFLLIREAVQKWHGKWYVPGGKADMNESPEMAAHREVWEEAGCKVNLKGIFAINYRERLFSKRMYVFYAATLAGDEQQIKSMADKHSLEAKWFRFEQVSQLDVRRGLEEILEAYRKSKWMPSENLRLSN